MILDIVKEAIQLVPMVYSQLHSGVLSRKGKPEMAVITRSTKVDPWPGDQSPICGNQ